VDPYRIVLADDHALLRHGIKTIIEGGEGMVVVGEASDGLELLEVLKGITTDMVILDISMAGLRGIEATSEIKMIYPEIKVLMLTMHKRKEYFYHALSAGADGYLLKEDTATELFSAIKMIREGGVYVSPFFSAELQEDVARMCRDGGELPVERITTREREVLKLIAEGKSSKEMADLLFISAHTIRHHRANIKRKLNIKKLADLIKYAIREGYTSDQ
jgi:DNA-binding NarL/FixJ family response regulator